MTTRPHVQPRPIGRPPKPPAARLEEDFRPRFTCTEAQQIRSTACALGISSAELIRRLVESALQDFTPTAPISRDRKAMERCR